jgi:hypothetical protein
MRPRIKREPHLKGETAVEYEERLKGKPVNVSSLSDMLLKRYVTDFIKVQQQASPLASLLKKHERGLENQKFTMIGKGAYFDKK